jgi:hypothetical protein
MGEVQQWKIAGDFLHDSLPIAMIRNMNGYRLRNQAVPRIDSGPQQILSSKERLD